MQRWCKECVKENTRTWRKANAEQAKLLGRRRRLKAYGLTEKAYAALLAAQCGECAICRAPCAQFKRGEPLHVDHDHETGQVRGLLCSPCNLTLGHFNDDPERLERAAEYLRAPPAPAALALVEPEPARTCEVCSALLEVRKTHKRYCGAACSAKAHRARKLIIIEPGQLSLLHTLEDLAA